MYYICPVCKLVVKGNSNMALHLTGHRKFSGKHENFLDSYILVREGDVKSNGKTDKDGCEPLMKLIEKECVLTD